MTVRLAKGQKILKLLMDCILRADRDMSTIEAGKTLQQGTEQLLKDSPIREEVYQLFYWPQFEVKETKTWGQRYANASEPTTVEDLLELLKQNKSLCTGTRPLCTN